MDGRVMNCDRKEFGSCRYMNTVKITLLNGEVIDSETPVMNLELWLSLVRMSSRDSLWRVAGDRYINLCNIADLTMIMNDYYKEGVKNG